MFKVTKENEGNSLMVRMSGGITERADFDQLIGETPQIVVICGKDVESINSAGIRNWVSYFQRLQKKRVKVRFLEFSPPLVECMNMISSFTCDVQVESIYVPFSCPDCLSDSRKLYSVQQLATLDLDHMTEACSQCGKPMLLDDIPEEFFSFMRRNHP